MTLQQEYKRTVGPTDECTEDLGVGGISPDHPVVVEIRVEGVI